MPRGPRLDAEGALHHVMVRGIEKRKIFRSDEDRHDLLERFGVVVPETGTTIYAWSLLPNHFHLLLRSGRAGLSTFMRRIQTGYAGSFNRRRKRTGHLFQNRFKSILVEEDVYFLELVRYLHLNPLRAGIVKSMRGLDAYPWSGHAVLMGKQEADWQDIEFVLGQFGSTLGRARQAYRQFVAEGVSQGKRPELSGGGLVRSIGGREKMSTFRRERQRWQADERVLGSGDFVAEVTKHEEERAARRIKPDEIESTLAALLDRVCSKAGVGIEEVRGRGRKHNVSRSRAVFAHEAVKRLGISMKDVACFLGVSAPAVSQMIAKAGKLEEEKQEKLN